MKIITSTALKFVPRNMARLLVSLNTSETTIRVDAHIFGAGNSIIIDDEPMAVVSVGGNGTGWQEYVVTRGGTPTIHIGGADDGANVLGPNPVELLSHTFTGSTTFSGVFIASPSDLVMCYEEAGTRKFYWPKAWGKPADILPWPPYDDLVQQVKILVWSHMPHAVSGALIG